MAFIVWVAEAEAAMSDWHRAHQHLALRVRDPVQRGRNLTVGRVDERHS